VKPLETTSIDFSAPEVREVLARLQRAEQFGQCNPDVSRLATFSWPRCGQIQTPDLEIADPLRSHAYVKTLCRLSMFLS